MMALAEINRLSDEAAARARGKGVEPRVFFDASDISKEFGRIPNIGSYRPRGWRLVESRLVDKTGWGNENEPALTIRGYQAWLNQHLSEDCGYAIIEEGQFQIVVGRFAQPKHR